MLYTYGSWVTRHGLTSISSLALAEMKTLLRDVYSDYSTTPHISMTEEAMAMSDQLISSRPLGQKCLLHFHPLDGSDIKTEG